jgi:hypothetical protein
MKKNFVYIAIFMAIVIYLFLDIKTSTSSTVTLEKKYATIKSKEKAKKQNIESKNIPLSKIINGQVREPDATKLWNMLKNSDFNSSDTIELLNQLWFARGAFKYYRELIDIANNKKLSDKVLANLIAGISSAYEGDRHNENSSIPFNKKDKVIQQFISNQIKNPKGKESYFMALERIRFTMNSDEIQEKMDMLLESNNLPIQKSDIYALKLRFSIYTSMGSEDELSLLKNISDIESIKNQKLKEELYDFSYRLQNSENKELLDEYQKILENNPIEIKDDNIEFHIEEEENIPIFANEEELQAYADQYINPKYEEKLSILNEKKNEYAKYIEAYSSTLNSFDEKINFYKSKIKNGSKLEQEAILYMLEERVDLNEDTRDIELIEQLRADPTLESLF